MSSHAETSAASFGSAAVAARRRCSSCCLVAKNFGSSNAPCLPTSTLKSFSIKEQLLVCLARLFWSSSYELFQLAAILRDLRNFEWKRCVAVEGQLRDRQLAARTTRVPGYENQVPAFRTVRAPSQVSGR